MWARVLRDNGLSIAMFALFLCAIIGQAITGWRALAEELRFHGLPSTGFLEYLTTGHFLSAVFENWESEFLQMAVYVVLTALLIQKGSPESKKPGEKSEIEMPADPNEAARMPWPVRRGGLALRFYSHSLSIALMLLFALSFGLHLVSSNQRSNEEAIRHQQPLKSVSETLGEPEFWYESFQNWQSEFLSIGVLIMLGIFLRQRGSPESKPVAAPHAETGH